MIIKKTLALICFSIFFITKNSYAQSWDVVGSKDFTSNGAITMSIALDTGGVPYVFYEDMYNYGQPIVRRFNGNTWDTVGKAGFSSISSGRSGLGVESTCIVITSDNIPYVSFVDYQEGFGISVMKYISGGWQYVGSPCFTPGQPLIPSLAIDGGGTPYVVYKDNINNFKATAMKFNGSSWVNVGSAGFSLGNVNELSMAIDKKGTPYVAIRGYVAAGITPNALTVMKFDGTSWINVGTPNITLNSVFYPSIAIDKNDTPYVAFMDGSNYDEATVIKFNGTSWVPVGPRGFSTSNVDYVSLALDENNVPYVGFRDHDGGYFTNYASMMKFNGTSWDYVGDRGFSGMQAEFTAIAIDKKGTPYMAFEDINNYSKAVVMRLDPTTGIQPLSGTQNEQLSVFPNPGTGEINLLLKSPLREDAKIIVTNAIGLKVKELTWATNKVKQIEIKYPGLYFITAITSHDIYNARVIIN